MSTRRHLGYIAAAATLLAAAPLSAIFDRWTWLVQCVVVVGLITGAAALTRWWRAPVWAQVLGMLAALLLGLTWLFPSGTELLAVLPTPGTLTHFGELLALSAEEMRAYGVPVQDTDALLFLTVLGVGGVAVIVDLLTVGLRRPALAGLPMLAIYSVPVAIYVDSVPVLPFMVGAVGFLWLLVADNVDRVRHFGRRFTGDGRDVDVWEPSPLAAAGRRLAVVGVVVAVLLPLAVPGMTSGLFDRFNTGTGSGTGSGPGAGQPGRVNLFAALSGELNRSEVRDLVKVTTDDPDPYYLRFAVADEFRRTGFATRTPSGNPVTRGLPDPRADEDRVRTGVTHHVHRASVEVLDFAMPFLPVYAEPIRTEDVDGNWLYDAERQIVFSHRASAKGRKYSFEYVRSEYTPQALAAAEPLPRDHPLRTRFTEREQVREVQVLVEQLIRGKRNDYDRVRAIYDYFSRDNGFSYSLATQGGTSGQDIVNFLTSKVGFCQQYAVAMAWLVREAGIPARVAFGFTTGTNRQDNTYTLTNLNLHAWTEVYFNGIGWVPFDATPAADVPGSTRSAWAPDVDAPDPTPSTPGGAAPSATTGPADNPATGNRPERAVDENLGTGAATTPESGPRWPWWTAAGVVLLLVLLAVPALRRSVIRRRRHARAAAATAIAATNVPADAPPGVARVLASDAELERARADAHAAWDELLDTMIDFRIRVDPAESPRATAERLSGLVSGEAGAAARLLGRAEERARYAREPLRDGSLGEALRAVRRALLARADRRTRIAAVTLPPSVLLRWRGALLDTSARLVGMIGRIRDRLLRWNPRRVLAGRPSR